MGFVSESFKARANQAAFWEAWVGAVLARANLYTLHHPFPADGSDDQALAFDLEVGSFPMADDMIPVEVKAYSQTFTCPEDYPFDDILVCSKNSWKRKWGLDKKAVQRDFLFVSNKTGCILWLPKNVDTFEKSVRDHERKSIQWSKATMSENLMPFGEFVKYVKEKT